MTVNLPKVRSDLLEEMNPEWLAVFQKTHSFNKFSWEQKRRENKFFDSKRTWKP